MKQLFVPNLEANILVVGDIILDRYVYGNTSRISPEAPVPIVHVKDTEERPGGAANVALNIRQLDVGVCLVGITGEDPSADLLSQILIDAGVTCCFVRQNGFPTITKLRVLSQHQQLIRLDYEAESDQADASSLDGLFNEQSATADLIVLSDYAKGSLMNVSRFIQQARDLGKQVLVDPKGTDFSRYQHASLLTPNLKEFKAVVGDCEDVDAIVTKGANLCQSLSLDALLVTRGEQGMTLIRNNDAPVHLTAQAHEVFDVTGAGDTVIASLAAALASGHELVHATALANRAAGLAVEKLGAATISTGELNSAVFKAQLGNLSVSDESHLKWILDNVRAEGKTIVMTNGCFDILHAGHVAYLQQARKMGDCLVVAVNDDDSVRKLKGSTRPVNPLADRMAVLAALGSVDWVVPFTEETPERLISVLLPDVLVKGGDYQPDEIAGAEWVKQNGGKVETIPLYEGCSTTRIINELYGEVNQGQ